MNDLRATGDIPTAPVPDDDYDYDVLDEDLYLWWSDLSLGQRLHVSLLAAAPEPDEAALTERVAAVLTERPTTLTVELIAKMWRDHAACNWVSDGTNVRWSCGIIHGLGGHSVDGLPIHMQPTTRDRHLAALLRTQIDAERNLIAAAIVTALRSTP